MRPSGSMRRRRIDRGPTPGASAACARRQPATDRATAPRYAPDRVRPSVPVPCPARQPPTSAGGATGPPRRGGTGPLRACGRSANDAHPADGLPERSCGACARRAVRSAGGPGRPCSRAGPSCLGRPVPTRSSSRVPSTRRDGRPASAWPSGSPGYGPAKPVRCAAMSAPLDAPAHATPLRLRFTGGPEAAWVVAALEGTAAGAGGERFGSGLRATERASLRPGQGPGPRPPDGGSFRL